MGSLACACRVPLQEEEKEGVNQKLPPIVKTENENKGLPSMVFFSMIFDVHVLCVRVCVCVCVCVCVGKYVQHCPPALF